MSVRKTFLRFIREFEIFDKLPYEKKMPKHEPTDRYFYLARQLAKCMVRYETLNRHNYGRYTKTTDLSLNVNSTDKDESKCVIVHGTLSNNCSANKNKSNKASSKNFIAELLRARGQTVFNGDRQIIIYHYETQGRREGGDI